MHLMLDLIVEGNQQCVQIEEVQHEDTRQLPA